MKVSDLVLLEIFSKAVQLKSFSKVAYQMGVTPSVISKKISTLEAQLGVGLFKRTTRSIQLTDDGQRLAVIVENVLDEMKKIDSDFDKISPQGLSGTLRISSPETYANARLVEVISNFSALHPKLQIDLVLTNSFLNLVDENIDVAFRVFRPADSGFKAVKIENNDLVFCAAPAFLKKYGALKRINDLKKHSVFYLSSHGGEKFLKSGQTIEKVFGINKISVNSGEVINQFGIAGYGAIVRSRWDVQRYIDAKKLVVLDLDDAVETKTAVYAVFPAVTYLPNRTRSFLDFVQMFFNQN